MAMFLSDWYIKLAKFYGILEDHAGSNGDNSSSVGDASYRVSFGLKFATTKWNDLPG